MLSPGLCGQYQVGQRRPAFTFETTEVFISWALLPRTRILGPLLDEKDWLRKAARETLSSLKGLFPAPSQAIIEFPSKITFIGID